MNPNQPMNVQPPVAQPQYQQSVQQPMPVQAQPGPMAPFRRSNVELVVGATAFSRVPAILEWSGDNRIRLFTADPSGQTVVQLDCLPGEISEFSLSMGSANMKLTDGRRFAIYFSMEAQNKSVASAVLGNFGLVGALVGAGVSRSASKSEGETDLRWWKDSLSRFGVGGSNISASSLYKIDKIGIILAVSIPVVILLVVIVVVLVGGAS